MITKFLQNYIPRHRNRLNQALHLIGVPLTFVGTPYCLIEQLPWHCWVGCFFGGYALQFVGHAIEGNDAGEVVFIKKKLGLPFTEYADRANGSSTDPADVDSTKV